MPEPAALQDRLGYRFHDGALLALALTHPSLAHDQNQPLPHNQRLEFLGDAVLGIILARQLYDMLPEADEGDLTKFRAKLVNAAALATHARALDLGTHLVLSRGEEHSGGRTRESTLADGFEALLGAIFLDGGYEPARAFVLREFAADFTTLAGTPAGIENPKGELQELLQARSPAAPHYQMLSATGPDHDRHFECAVLHDGVELARGCGKSKKAAESEAALAALQRLRTDPPAAEGQGALAK